MAKEITVIEALCPECQALLGIQEGTFELHVLEHGQVVRKPIETVEANPGWQLRRYLENQVSIKQKDLDTLPSFNVNPDSAPVEVDPSLVETTNKALQKDLADRGIFNITTTD